MLGAELADTSVARGTLSETVESISVRHANIAKENARAIKTSSHSLYVNSEYFFFISPSKPYTLFMSAEVANRTRVISSRL